MCEKTRDLVYSGSRREQGKSLLAISKLVSLKNVQMNWKLILASMGPRTAQAMKELMKQECNCSCMQLRDSEVATKYAGKWILYNCVYKLIQYDVLINCYLHKPPKGNGWGYSDNWPYMTGPAKIGHICKHNLALFLNFNLQYLLKHTHYNNEIFIPYSQINKKSSKVYRTWIQ